VIDLIDEILIPFIVVGLAELGDKTQLSILLLSSKMKSHSQLLLGVILGFLFVDGFAVLLGSWIMKIIPLTALKILSALVFIAFGILILRSNDSDTEGKTYSKNAFISGFLLISLTEWGDKTQIAAGLFATKYHALMVLAGAMAALTLLSVIAVYVSKALSDRINRGVLTKFSGVLFILMGVWSILI